jgi:hypothetical protein
MPDPAAVHAEVSRTCRGVRTLTAELGLSGRAGDQRLRGRVLAGFTREGAMRLEGLAPFGPPAFVLAARPARAVLWLPRDKRVVEHANAADILGALTGVPLAPPDLLAVITGCVSPAPVVTGGRLHERGWATIDLGGQTALYLRRAGQAWEVRAEPLTTPPVELIAAQSFSEWDFLGYKFESPVALFVSRAAIAASRSRRNCSTSGPLIWPITFPS